MSDNSSSLGGNPDPPNMEVATASVAVGTAGAATVGSTVNVTQKAGYQGEAAIATNPTNSQNLVVLARDDTATNGLGLFEAYSTNGGATWTGTDIAIGTDWPECRLAQPECPLRPVRQLFRRVSRAAGREHAEHRGDPAGPTEASPSPRSAPWRAGPATTSRASRRVRPERHEQRVGDLEQRHLALAAGAAVSGLGTVGSFQAPEAVPG